MRYSMIVLLFLLSFLSAEQGSETPMGYWKTIDDKTNEAKSVVFIWREGDKLRGKVDEILNPDRKNSICDKCEGERKNKPIEGMTIIWDMEKDGNEYTGGRILDPESGKTYKCKIKLNEQGNELTVRGFIGFSLLGRSQTWYRVEKKEKYDADSIETKKPQSN